MSNMSPEDREWITGLWQKCTDQVIIMSNGIREEVVAQCATIHERIARHQDYNRGELKLMRDEVKEHTEGLSELKTKTEHLVSEVTVQEKIEAHVSTMHRPWIDRMWNLLLTVAAGLLGWYLGKGS